jgi:hypothetical protein
MWYRTAHARAFLDLRMPGVADKHNLAAAALVAFNLPVHLRNQRTHRVIGDETAAARVPGDGWRDPVRGEDHH